MKLRSNKVVPANNGGEPYAGILGLPKNTCSVGDPRIVTVYKVKLASAPYAFEYGMLLRTDSYFVNPTFFVEVNVDHGVMDGFNMFSYVVGLNRQFAVAPVHQDG